MARENCSGSYAAAIVSRKQNTPLAAAVVRFYAFAHALHFVSNRVSPTNSLPGMSRWFYGHLFAWRMSITSNVHHNTPGTRAQCKSRIVLDTLVANQNACFNFVIRPSPDENVSENSSVETKLISNVSL